MSHIGIFYGTVGGNTELVCQAAAQQLEQHQHQVSLQRIEQTSAEDLLGVDLVVLASPTYGHGDLSPAFPAFLKTCETLDWTGRKVAVIGLGDNKYDDDYAIESSRTLAAFFRGKSAELVIPPLEIHRSIGSFLGSKVPQWATKLSEALAEKSAEKNGS